MPARQLNEEYYEDYYEDYFDELPSEEKIKIHRKIVKRNIQRNPLKRKAIALFLTATLLCGSVLIASSRLASEVYELGQIRSDAQMMEKSNENLRVENARMKAHSRIKEIAVKELGMTVPQGAYFAGEQAR
ncbi:MAG: cell division protein FtsL [Anaerovibrio sp.]|uniref:cell division protein FtsL n=1 Tax=Anaerovibrio sp. TaxID=1872532 RepID=UPI0025F50AF6|nr:cell division protein FtsL [Anaerovibrio sp.]MCR5175396.1 cell division protein FtsL [Anaerovibrio sp.]